jgi:hypothetical protein
VDRNVRVERGAGDTIIGEHREARLRLRDALHLLRAEFRKVRGVMDDAMRRHAAELPAAGVLADEDSSGASPDGGKTTDSDARLLPSQAWPHRPSLCVDNK